MSSPLPKLIVILGPTASGKTGVCLDLCKDINGEVISADSRQVYRGMDIGTAKTAGMWQTIQGKEVYVCDEVPHYLIDCVNPDEEFSLAQYQGRAFDAIEDILKRKKYPVLCGGTGLYISAVVENYLIPEKPADVALRNEFEKQTPEALFEKISALSEDTAERVDPKNKRRLIRALEVLVSKNQNFKAEKGKPRYEVLQIGLDIPREELYRRINERVDAMMDQGLLEETKNLLQKYPASLPSMSGIGYRELVEHLQGTISLPQAVEKIKKDTRNYAKRQLTWFRRDKSIHWVKSFDEAREITETFLGKT